MLYICNKQTVICEKVRTHPYYRGHTTEGLLSLRSIGAHAWYTDAYAYKHIITHKILWKSESQREHAHLTTHAQNHCMRALYCGLHCEKMEPWSPSLLSGTIDDLITAYFQAGHRYKKIVQFLCCTRSCAFRETTETETTSVRPA